MKDHALNRYDNGNLVERVKRTYGKGKNLNISNIMSGCPLQKPWSPGEKDQFQWWKADSICNVTVSFESLSGNKATAEKISLESKHLFKVRIFFDYTFMITFGDVQNIGLQITSGSVVVVTLKL